MAPKDHPCVTSRVSGSSPDVWTGFYAGVNAGYGFDASQNVTVTTSGAQVDAKGNSVASASGGSGVFPINSDGFVGGGQVGYSWQFNNQFVLGLEADIQGFASSSGTVATNSTTPTGAAGGLGILSALQVNKSIDYLGAVRGRLGFLINPVFLVYATGGLAYGGVNASTQLFQGFAPATPAGLTPGFGASGSYSDTRVGWTVGGGAEWLFHPNWSAKLEYLYYDLGSATFGGGSLGATNAAGAFNFNNVVTASTHFSGHVVRVGLNYHFNWAAPAPVVAKY
jgi:outer membrane immunogenic protein